MADGDQRVVNSTCSTPPWRDLDVAWRGAGELRLIHLPNLGIDPDILVEVCRAICANVEDADLRPEGVLVDVEVLRSRDTLAIHDRHVFGSNGEKISDSNIGKVVLEQREGLLALLHADAVLGVCREPLWQRMDN